MNKEETRELAEAIVDVFFQRLTKPAAPVAAPHLEPEYMKVTAFAKSSGYCRTTIQKFIKLGMPAVAGTRGHRVHVVAARRWLELGGATGGRREAS